MKRSLKKENILVLSAHSDDFVLGAGGTIAEYARQGKKVQVIIFSYGVKSHPWLKEKVTQKMRVDEAKKAAKLLRCRVSFFDLEEFQFERDFPEKKIAERLLRLIAKIKPGKIFTHSHEDPHPDHQAVNSFTLSLYDQISPPPELFIYSVWNPVSLRTQWPALYVNISQAFTTKIKALKSFPSQRLHIVYPSFLVLFRALIEGRKIKARFAEKFFRLK